MKTTLILLLIILLVALIISFASTFSFGPPEGFDKPIEGLEGLKIF